MTTRKATTTVPNNQSLDELEAEAQAAINKAAQARAAAEQVRQRAEQARARAEREHDEQVLQEWRADRAQLDADVEAARQRLTDAVLADPTWQAYADLALASHRRTTRSLEAGSTSARLSGGAGFQPIPGVFLPGFEDLVTVVRRHAEERGQAEAAEREQRRVDAGQAAADKEAGR